MPITDKAAYGPGWDAWSADIRRNRAGNRCECQGECGSPRHRAGRCRAINGARSPMTGSRVVLTVAHRHGTAKDTRDGSEVFAACQLCHLAYDAELHARHRAENRAAKQTTDGGLW